MKATKCVFTILFMSYFIVRFDHGIIPAMNTAIRKEYGFSNIEMGTLGSAVYLGNVVGSLFAMPLFNFFPTKCILVICLTG